MMTTDIDVFFSQGCGRCDRFATPACSAQVWAEGLAALRRICLSLGLEETVKWGYPCYMHAGRNIVVMGAFKTDFRLSFFHPALMKDPDGVLELAGDNSQHKSVLRFHSMDQVTKSTPIIESYLREAMSYAAEGIKPPVAVVELVLPEELVEALAADEELAEAFYRLTPGRQKSYVINLNSAKQSKTRLARIDKFRDKIFAGKGALER